MLKVVEPTQEHEPVAPARPRRAWRRVAIGALACFVVVGVLAGGFYWQATRSSIRIGYLTTRVEAAIAQRLPSNAKVQVGSTAFSYRSDKGVILRIRDLALSLPGMADVAISELSTTTTAAALMGGRIDLRSVTVTGADIAVSGAPKVTPQEGGTGADLVRQAVTAFVDQVVGADNLMRDAGLREVVVREASVRVGTEAESESDSPKIMIGEANWLPLSPNRSKAWLQVVEAGSAGWDLTVERRQTQSGNAVVTLEFEDVPVATLAPALAGNDDGPYFHSAVTLQTRMTQAPDGHFVGLRGTLSAADGELSLSGEDRINVASMAVGFVLDETRRPAHHSKRRDPHRDRRRVVRRRRRPGGARAHDAGRAHPRRVPADPHRAGIDRPRGGRRRRGPHQLRRSRDRRRAAAGDHAGRHRLCDRPGEPRRCDSRACRSRFR